jgi:ATP-dependent DNA helicase RecG
MNSKVWVSKAIDWLEDSLTPVPQELNEIDWKLDLSSNNKKLTHHLSAFANHPGGGYLAFGIDDKTGTVVGIATEKIGGIVERLASLSRDTVNPEAKLDHTVITYRGETVLIVHIRESSIKPVHLKTGSIEDTHIRTGGTTRIATRHEVAGLMLNSKAVRYEELHASKLLDRDEILSLIDYQAILELLNRPTTISAEEALSWMVQERMLEQIDGSGYYITNFGAITAAKNLSQFDGLERKAIRVIKYSGLNKVTTEREQTGQKGYAIGFSGLIGFIEAMLPHSEVIKKALRTETCIYPPIALRELIANSLVHQDFSVKGKSPMIEVYENRIEISNPGRLLPSKKIDRLIGTNPESRNDLLAAAMRRYKICEERGSGLIKALDAIELFGLPPLQFEQGENYFKVTMFSPKTFAEMTPRERIEACYQHATLKYLSGGGMTNTTLRERLKVPEKSRSMISRVIKDATDAGKVKAKNPDNPSTKFTEYVPYWV